MTDLELVATLQIDLDRSWCVPPSFASFDNPTLIELVELYVEDTGESVRRLRTAYSCADIGAIGRLAHTLKGSSRNFHVPSIANTCEAIEDLSRKRLLEPVGPLLETLEEEFPNVAAAMRQVVGA